MFINSSRLLDKMAIITLEDFSINATNESLQVSAPFIVEQGVTNLLFLQVNPPDFSLRNGYILVIPALTLGGRTIAKPRPVKYFPRGALQEIPIAVPDITSQVVQGFLGFLPIAYYNSGIVPRQFEIRISYENSVFPPLGYPV
jgi:hypothetical protein